MPRRSESLRSGGRAGTSWAKKKESTGTFIALRSGWKSSKSDIERAMVQEVKKKMAPLWRTLACRLRPPVWRGHGDLHGQLDLRGRLELLGPRREMLWSLLEVGGSAAAGSLAQLTKMLTRPIAGNKQQDALKTRTRGVEGQVETSNVVC